MMIKVFVGGTASVGESPAVGRSSTIVSLATAATMEATAIVVVSSSAAAATAAELVVVGILKWLTKVDQPGGEARNVLGHSA